VLTAIDICTRECVALVAAKSFSDVPPAEYRAGGYYVPDLQRLENSLI
jgi:hypothetical protein